MAEAREQATSPGEGDAKAYGDSKMDCAEQLTSYETASASWRKGAAKVSKVYETGPATVHASQEMGRWNVLWANTQVILPNLIMRPPKPVVTRRFMRDDLGKLTTEFWRQALEAEIRQGAWVDAFEHLALDLILVARGTVWLGYEAGIEPDGDDERVTSEEVGLEYTHWSDFAHAPLRTWQQVQRYGWVARRVWLGDEAGKERFGDAWKKVPEGKTAKDMSDAGSYVRKATGNDPDPGPGVRGIWEFWNAPDRRVKWLSAADPNVVLEESGDFLGLDGFFPCPKPCYGSRTNKDLFPLPSYLQYEAAAQELSALTYQIGNLLPELRVVIGYDPQVSGSTTPWQEQNRGRSQLVPMPGLSENSGSPWASFPIQDVFRVVEGLISQRQAIKAQIDELEGISDITRGYLQDTREKLGQSQLKAQATSNRMAVRQNNFMATINEAVQLTAEIQARHYAPERLREMGGFDYLPEVQRLAGEVNREGVPAPDLIFEQVYGLLQTDRQRSIQITVDTASVREPDLQKEREDYINMVANVTPLLFEAVSVPVPEAAKVLLRVLLTLIQKFQGGSVLEDEVNGMIAAIEEQAAGGANADPNAQPQVDPETGEPIQADPNAPTEAEQTAESLELRRLMADVAASEAEAQARTIKALSESERAQLRVQAERMRSQLALQKGQADASRAQAALDAQLLELTARIDEIEGNATMQP